jgi:PIN domain nuclease of toxin-antitoxin system
VTARLLVDTHILVHWIAEPRRLSGEQLRLMREAARKQEPVAISAITLVELALLRAARARIQHEIEQTLNEIESSQTVQILPLTVDIAREVTPLVPILRDPSDCVIVATARVHGLRLLTSDERILDSNLVQVVG